MFKCLQYYIHMYVAAFMTYFLQNLLSDEKAECKQIILFTLISLCVCRFLLIILSTGGKNCLHLCVGRIQFCVYNFFSIPVNNEEILMISLKESRLNILINNQYNKGLKTHKWPNTHLRMCGFYCIRDVLC